MESKNKRLAALRIDARNEVARLDMATGLSGIARPLKKGAARQAFITRQKWNGGEISLRGVALDDTDIGVLLALLVLAEQRPPSTNDGKEIEGLLPPMSEKDSVNLADSFPVVTVKSSFSAVCDLLGIEKSGPNNRKIWDSLSNLATIVLSAQQGKDRTLTHLIMHGRGRDESLSVSLSYRLTRALMGNGSYAKVDMAVFRALPRGSARLLYVWLSSWFINGSERVISINSMVEHVWGDKVNSLPPSSLKERRRKIKNSIRGIETASSGYFSFVHRGENITVNRAQVNLLPPQGELTATSINLEPYAGIGETGVLEEPYKPSIQGIEGKAKANLNLFTETALA